MSHMTLKERIEMEDNEPIATSEGETEAVKNYVAQKKAERMSGLKEAFTKTCEVLASLNKDDQARVLVAVAIIYDIEDKVRG